MRRIKLLISLVCALLIALPAFSASMEEWQLAELLAQPQGRMRVSGNSIVMRVWYDDDTSRTSTYATIGISRSSADINLYEAGALTAKRLSSGQDFSIEYDKATSNTVGEIVDIINSDSSEYWNAELGPDGWEDLNAAYMQIFRTDVAEATAGGEIKSCVGDVVEFYLDVDGAKGYSVGVQAEDNARIRLKQIEEASTASRGPHWVEVWSGGEKIFFNSFTASETCIRGSNTGEEIVDIGGDTNTPNTVNLAEGHQGLGGKLGENLCVVTRWDSNATMQGALQADNGTYATGNIATGNVSILYDIVKP